jgi:hypothetical protein
MLTIWDLKKGQKFLTVDGDTCEVIAPTEDGKGLLARYLDESAVGEEDFVFEDEIEFMDDGQL